MEQKHFHILPKGGKHLLQKFTDDPKTSHIRKKDFKDNPSAVWLS